MQVTGGSGNNSILDVNRVNDDPTVNVNSINSTASKLLMKAADERSPLDPDDPDDPNDPANIAQQEEKVFQQQLDNRAAENDITTGTNTGVATSANNQVAQVAQAAHGLRDSFSNGENHANTALSSIQSRLRDGPTERQPGLQNVSVRNFDPHQRV